MRKQIRMIYVVHKTGPDAEQAVRSNVAPSADKLGKDVAHEVKPGEPGAMAKVLAKRKYFLNLGGKLHTPEDIAAWV
jgi:hypothetical protein